MNPAWFFLPPKSFSSLLQILHISVTSFSNLIRGASTSCSFIVISHCHLISSKDEREHCLQTEEIIKSNPAPANVSLLALGKSHNQEVTEVV